MSLFFLALRCFFAVLFRSRLPDDAVRLLPAPVAPVEKGKCPTDLPTNLSTDAKSATQSDERAVSEKVEPVKAIPESPSQEPEKREVSKPVDLDAVRQRGAVQLLSVLQREGRLVDFLLEDIDGYGDAQIGAAVRDIHRGCKKGLLEHLPVAPIRPEPDEAVVKIVSGHDPSQIRLVGHVTGKPPFEGSLRHHGWRIKKFELADIPSGHDPSVICPAEVEIAG